MNDQNLVDIRTRATRVQREIQSKGGLAHAEKVREQKMIASAVSAYLNGTSETTGNKNLDDKVKEALSGEITIRDLKTLAEILGELVNKQDVTTNGEAIEEVALIFGKPLPKYDKNKGDSSSR